MSLKGKVFYVFLSAILAIITINKKAYFLLLIFLILLFLAYKKYSIKYCGILLVVFLFFSIYRINMPQEINNLKINETFKVKEVKETYVIIKNTKGYYIMYPKDNQKYEVNDKLYIEGRYELLQKDLDIYVFEFKDYLNNKRIFYQVIPYRIVIKERNTPLNIKIISFLTSKLKSDSLSMTKMLLFNDKSIDKDSYENLKEINAVHLFVVSGFHISFIYSIINKLIKTKKIISNIISLLICCFYVYLLNFSISALRAVLTIGISTFFKDKLNALDSLSISGILILLIEPLNVFNYSFIMSFVLTFTIIICNKILKRYNKVFQMLLISLVCFLVMFPIQLSLNYEVNFLSLLSNIILSYVVIFIFLLCIVGIVISFINGNIFGIIYEKFNDLVEYFASLNTSVVFGNMNIYLMIVYYLVLFFILYNFEQKKYKKSGLYGVFMFVFFILFYNRHIFVLNQQVTFLNVNQGDCCIIQDSFNGKIMLIDTGGSINYDIASKKIIPYLKYKGIKKIDLVVISHDDYDHNGALSSLKKQIRIDKIIDDYNIKCVSLGKLKFTNLNNYCSEYNDKNDNSIVLYGKINDLNYLFTGDISASIESKIIIDNPNLKVDVLKVSHHGSKTSTSDNFIKRLDLKFAIISVGSNNIYNHPNNEVINVLEKYNIKIYRTDIVGTIIFKGKIYDYWFIEVAK